ncbi:hypothetical protein Poli38472_011653 [Pythium oligandrum]|uniref:Mini-chromosome maintenance complex-binding protein n=1 Tax=Pythium oligandrum TaxID=41045 RepID=A0A8K1CKS0_PYTOL|nr:hypothetical protein Poli38472_011653 [Pythium oligandrum]|eukprot:TMW64773.1 hypothetical protein Poli38472_011653 [Pythium oligandrum]
MLELQQLLRDYRSAERSERVVRVFDDVRFRRGQYDDGAVLKFRGIVRDVLDPEFVLLAEGDESGDVVASNDEMEHKYVERVPLKVALVPHVTDWAKKRYHDAPGVEKSEVPMDQAVQTPSKGVKRSNDAMEEVVEEAVDVAMEDASTKKAKAGESTTADEAIDSPFDEQVVSMYVYDGQYPSIAMDAFKVNESFEFIGILDMMVLGSGGHASRDDTALTEQAIEEWTISECFEDMHRKQQASVVFHCADAVKLDGLHMVQPHQSAEKYAQTLTSNVSRTQFLASELSSRGQSTEIPVVRAALISHLARALGGDDVAAEYLLLCLLSRVYARPDPSTALGHLSVNLSAGKAMELPVVNGIVERLTSVLQEIVPMLATVDMSIKSLTESKFAPHKDYDQDVLRGGVLQFAHGTTVLANETALSTGNLNEQGVKNMGALQSLVEKMLLPYDFQYYSMDFPQDVAVISVSQGKSILPVHVTVSLAVTTTDTTAPTDALLECFRLYLAVLRTFTVNIGNEQAELAEKHYVACRKAKQEVSVDDLHRWLRLVRLIALSHGEDEVSTTSWDAMLALEGKRIDRIDAIE